MERPDLELIAMSRAKRVLQVNMIAYGHVQEKYFANQKYLQRLKTTTKLVATSAKEEREILKSN